MPIENHKDELKKISCSWCHEPLVDSIYVSIDCKFRLHKSCFKLPTQIDHPLHRMHTLILEFHDKNRFCKLCQKEDKEHFFYHCLACTFHIHLECIWPRPTIDDKRYHEHPFTLFWRQHLFTCDACGTNGDCASYICATCHLQVHVKCASLPRAIKITRHDHPLVHKYSFKIKELEQHDCQVCLEELKTEYGHYHCWKEDCYYVFHVECATGDSNLYEIFYPKNPENLFEDEEAIKIRDFLDAEHNLYLEEDMMIEKEDDNPCTGCVLPINTTPFYGCLTSKCDFVLHKACADLPKKKRHWYNRFPATLRLEDIYKCKFCGLWCSGFFYRILSSDGRWFDFCFDICLRCFKIPPIVKHEGHQHRLLFDHKWKEQCNACGGSSGVGAFRCKNRTFTLDFACVTLPLAVQHKSDEHLLKLSYHEDNEDAEQHYCDICETKRDPNHWYYRCATCDNSAHPTCVLGKYPFVKIGTTYKHRRHPHPVTCARRIYEYPAECHVCGKHCDDLSLHCTPCNYIQHWDCNDP